MDGSGIASRTDRENSRDGRSASALTRVQKSVLRAIATWISWLPCNFSLDGLDSGVERSCGQLFWPIVIETKGYTRVLYTVTLPPPNEKAGDLPAFFNLSSRMRAGLLTAKNSGRRVQCLAAAFSSLIFSWISRGTAPQAKQRGGSNFVSPSG